MDNLLPWRVTATGINVIDVWLGAPEAERLFDADRLRDADRVRLSELRGELRRREFAVSRALRDAALGDSSDPSSLSHSHGWASVARGHSKCSPALAIGVDLEFHRQRNLLGIARFAFDAAEIAVLEALDPGQQPGVFYALWTMKEAMAKALRIPLLVASRQCVFLPPEPSCTSWRGSAPTGLPWMARAFAPRPDMALSVVIIGSDCSSVTCREWPPERPGEWKVVAAIQG